ncbi:MAG TPA: NAD(P)-dependent oxidoreductase [Kofleriaceae bacterium]|jgi:nucleoside-diphosphate-sugar epimerase|nr:NAD(P)-dependent oxidoreductase [Kofleriaceae bacterium]
MILVTGATGVVGQFVVEELLRRGHPVRALCRSEEAARRLDPRAERATGDLRDLATLSDALRGATAIVHAACTFTERDRDVDAMAALLAGWPRGPFVFLSSLDVYGFAGAEVITEDTPLTESSTDYARGKVICERLLADAARRAGRSDCVALRAPYIWGPHPTAYKRLVPKRMLDGAPIVLPGAEPAEWNEYRDAWVDARDLAGIVAEALARPPGEPLNVATGHFVWHDLYAALIRLTGSPAEIIHRPLDEIRDAELPRKQLYAQRSRFSEQRLASRLGDVPRRPLDVTLRDTVGARG